MQDRITEAEDAEVRTQDTEETERDRKLEEERCFVLMNLPHTD